MSDKEIIGQTGAVTGFDTPDPKEGDPDTIYSSTPTEDRVGSADQSAYQAVELPPAKEVTGAFDQLATRDIGAMEHATQTPEYAGAQSLASLGISTEALDTSTLTSGLGVPLSQAVVQQHIGAAADQNPDYTPPSQKVPSHVRSDTVGLPADENPELRDEV